MHFLLKSLSPLQSGTEQSPVITINVTRLCVSLNLSCVYVSETKSIIKTAVKVAVDVIGNSKEENVKEEPNVTRNVS